MTTSASHLDIIDRSAEKAHVWVNELADELGTDDRHYAYRVLRAFLHALRDRLSPAEAAQLAAQLPIFVRGVFYEGWEPARAASPSRDLHSFLAGVAGEGVLAGDTEASFAVAAAARVLRRRISEGESASVLHELPAHVRELLDPAP